jgi:hypothetical protein
MIKDILRYLSSWSNPLTMKAYRQITFAKEHRLVWSYAVLLMIAGFILMIRPVLAQDREQPPGFGLDVKKDYEQQGSRIQVDPGSTWAWSDPRVEEKEPDSVRIRLGVGMDYHDFLPRNFDPYGCPGFAPGPPLHKLWEWHGEDSTAYSYLEVFLDEESLRQLKYAYNLQRLREMEARIELYRQAQRELIEKYF